MSPRRRVSRAVAKKFKAPRALAQRLHEDVRSAKTRKTPTRDVAPEDAIFLRL